MEFFWDSTSNDDSIFGLKCILLKIFVRRHSPFPFQVSEVDIKFYDTYFIRRKDYIFPFDCPVNIIKAFLKFPKLNSS